MRLTFLVNHDLASNLALSYLQAQLTDHESTIFYTDKPSRSKNTATDLQALASYEAKALEDPKLNWLKSPRSGAEKINNVNVGEGFERYHLSQPDLVISIRHMSILQSTTIATPKHGIINLHSGLLPEYRGVMATFWALLNKEQDLGSTLHFIDDAKIDTGRIIAQSKTPARFDQSYLWNVLNLYKGGCADIVRAINSICKQGSLPSHAQTGQANYYTFPSQSILDNFTQPLFKQCDTLSHFFD